MDDVTETERVIVIVLDGLRPDAIEKYSLTNLARFISDGASTTTATTVRPSITTAAMASLLTGVGPALHGIASDGILFPRFDSSVLALPALLSKAGYPSSAFMAEIPPVLRALAGRLGRRLGLCTLRSVGRSAWEVVEAASATIRSQKRGLILLHWPDADRAGHSTGWMSPEYAQAARRLDQALHFVTQVSELETDPSTLLILLADHGGGGVVQNDHGQEHPLNRTIFIAMRGGGIRAGQLSAATILDIPPTVLWALGLEPPPVYEGRVLDEAFGPSETTSPVLAGRQ